MKSSSQVSSFQKRGIQIEINPQKSYDNPNGYLSYVTALHLSKYTINFSRAGGINKKQLKCRALETALFGNFMISDEKKYSSLYFKKGRDFADFVDVRKSKYKLENIRLEISSIERRENALNQASFLTRLLLLSSN